MNNKITFPELVELVAKKANTSKRVSELFLKELFATITQSLTEGESVKVKGLGTFKLTTVSARKSVNVNTGEEINIPGHNKLTFVPDKELADAVNQPFAQFETEILSEFVTDEQLAAIDTDESLEDTENHEIEHDSHTPVEPIVEQEKKAEEQPEVVAAPILEMPPAFVPRDDEDEDDEVNEEEEKPTSSESEEDSEPVVPPTPLETPPPLIVGSNKIPQQEAVEQPTETTSQESQGDNETKKALVEKDIENLQYIRQMEQEFNEERVESEKEKRSIAHRSWLEGFLIGVVATLIVILVSYRVFLMSDDKAKEPAKQEQSATSEEASQEATTEDSATAEAPAETSVAEESSAEESSSEETSEPAKEEASESAPEEKATPGSTTDTVNRSTTLSKMSSKHYGNEFFWVYIYEENKAKYPDPNNIPEGSVLTIPPASKYGIDKDDPNSVAKAKDKVSQILGGK